VDSLRDGLSIQAHKSTCHTRGDRLAFVCLGLADERKATTLGNDGMLKEGIAIHKKLMTSDFAEWGQTFVVTAFKRLSRESVALRLP
jgi:hypothetical protein